MRSNHALQISLLLLALSACDGGPDPNHTTGTTSSGSGGAGGGSAQGDVPTDPNALFAFLKAGNYLGFPKESAVHPSAGPHFGTVRTYLSPTLEASLKAGNAEHPIHAAVVKELYMNSPNVGGWAVMVKTHDKSDGGKGWFWYETTSTTNPSPSFAGEGIPLCYNCHVTGKDFVLTPFPLL
jgi:hypothetical protein